MRINDRQNGINSQIINAFQSKYDEVNEIINWITESIAFNAMLEMFAVLATALAAQVDA